MRAGIALTNNLFVYSLITSPLKHALLKQNKKILFQIFNFLLKLKGFFFFYDKCATKIPVSQENLNMTELLSALLC